MSIADGLLPMTAREQPAVLALLRACGLPVDDVREEPGSAQFVWREDGVVVATVGVDVDGDIALLRSLAVAPACRGRGLGRTLTLAAEAHAIAGGADTLVLLTSTARGLVEGLGYRETSRCALGERVAAFRQFAAACCAEASCYVKRVGNADG